MRWFKHFSDARNNPKLHAIEKRLGEVGYARAFKLLELVAERGGTGEAFTPRISLNNLHTNLSWIADALNINVRAAKSTLKVFADVRLVDPHEYSQGTIYIPQMREYLDEWTRKRQSSASGSRPEERRSNSPVSQRLESQAHLEVQADAQLEPQSEPTANHRPADGRLTDNPVSSREKNDVNAHEPGDGDGQFYLPEWMHQDPWKALGIDRRRVPKRFRLDADGDPYAPTFECRFKEWWNNYRFECREAREQGSPREFAEYALSRSEEERVEYPPVLLKRKKELDGQ